MRGLSEPRVSGGTSGAAVCVQSVSFVYSRPLERGCVIWQCGMAECCSQGFLGTRSTPSSLTFEATGSRLMRCYRQVVVNACISAAEAGRQWPWALELLFFAKKELRPDIITYNTAVSACEKSSEWQRAFQLLRELQDRWLQPDSTSYGAAILAAGPLHWTAAFSLLEEMLERRITPQLATFTQLLMECELRGLAGRERSLLLALPEALEASASAVTETSASGTREDVSLLVQHVAAQKCLLSGDLDGCTGFLHRLDRAGQWNPLAEALWLRAQGNSVKNRSEGETPSTRARAPPVGLRAGRAKELRLCRHVFASASMGDAKSVCEARGHAAMTSILEFWLM